MPLSVASGYATQAGPRERNEDFLGMVTPGEPELSSKGLIAAIADGVSGNAGGREAAEYSVRGLLSDYYATPDTWPVTQALDRVIKSINGWVQSQSIVRRDLAGMASTLTVLVLRGGFYHFSHVGDTRLYLLRGGVLTRLTTDHVWDRPEMAHVLTRAIGLDSRLAIDHGMGELRERDVLLLVSDGIWTSLREYDITLRLAELAQGRQDASTTAGNLVEAALAAGAADNCSAMVLRVDELPAEDWRDAAFSAQQLPVPPKFKPGEMIDGYRIDDLLHTSSSTLLYRVTELRTLRPLVMKTLQPDFASDVEKRSSLAHEEWLGKRAVARFFPQVIVPEQKSCLYYLTTWHAGDTVRQMLDAGVHFTVPEVVTHGLKLVRAIGALHRRSILHRDIKPDNVHIGKDGELRVLDLGTAQAALESGEHVIEAQVSPSAYLAPEQFDGEPPSRQTDVYSVGVMLYYVLTRHYPYGEIEPSRHPRFGKAVPPTRYRPDIPLWLENVLLKAVARDPTSRFETAEEFLLALERGATHPLPAPEKPLAQRDPLSTWRTIAIAALVANLLLLYLLLAQ